MNSERIKFLVISSAYPYRGGISDSTHSFCNELVDSGESTEVWTFSLLYPSFLFPGNTQYSRERYEQKFQIKRKINTINPFNWLTVSKKINKLSPEVVILRYWSPILCLPYYFISFFLSKKIRVIGIVDNWKNHEKIPFESILRKLFLKSCSKFISFSENIAEMIRFNTRKEVLSLYHPINTNLPIFKEKAKAKNDLNLKDYKYVTFVGLIRKYKGVQTFIKSINCIKDDNIKFIIAGEFYDSLNEYKQLVDELNLSEKILIDNNFLELDRIRDYICASELIVQPYINASQSGITPLAYFYNKPLVVSKVRGLKEIINKDQSGEVFDKTPENLAKAILNCIDEKRNQLYVSNIIKAKNYYSWSTFVKKIKTI
ncbi:MAG: glycosyltransferase [Bacteroidota bacterium]|nr:glycosyltransferase [Bacteroidota bacterium]